MWPFSRKTSRPVADPYADYMDSGQYLGSSACADFTEAEREAARLGLAVFGGRRFNPEIASQMFGAVASAALANYAVRIISENSGDLVASTLAFAALERAMRCFQHPALSNRIADLLDAQGQPEAAKTARQTALILQESRRPSECDLLFLQNLQT